jgi:hypothetical protein
MPSYNFKKKVKFYVVTGGLKYRVDIFPDISFSQTFKEESRKVKTLHTPTNMFDVASITEANPANFDFTMPLYASLEVRPVLNLLLSYAIGTSEVTLETADIYVDTGTEIFKLEKAVFERGTFNISKTAVISVSISGTASKLTRYGLSGVAVIPGSQRPETSGSSIFLEQRYMLVEIGGIPQPSVSNVSIEVVNDVQWLPNNTLHKSLNVTGPSDTSYPGGFVVSGRNVSGIVQQYLTDENRANLQTWALNAPLNIWLANTMGLYKLKFALDQVVYTNRLEPGELFMQNYDFRLVSNPTDLTTLIQYT